MPKRLALNISSVELVKAKSKTRTEADILNDVVKRRAKDLNTVTATIQKALRDPDVEVDRNEYSDDRFNINMNRVYVDGRELLQLMTEGFKIITVSHQNKGFMDSKDYLQVTVER